MNSIYFMGTIVGLVSAAREIRGLDLKAFVAEADATIAKRQREPAIRPAGSPDNLIELRALALAAGDFQAAAERFTEAMGVILSECEKQAEGQDGGRAGAMTTVKEEWEAFATATLPADAPPVQVQEMRRAFYAGVWSFLQAQLRAGDDMTLRESLALLSATEAECRAFKGDVVEGRA